MSIGERLKQFIVKCYQNQINFSEIIGLNQATISRYIKNTHQPDSENLIKMQEIGISIDWLLTGIGSMYADNPLGRQFRAENVDLDCDPEEPYKDRIIRWIKFNFGSIENFAICSSYPFNKLYKIIEQNEVIPTEIIDLLAFSGCNTDWILCTSNQMYNETIMGIYLKHKKSKNGSDDGLIFKKKYTFDEILNSMSIATKLLQK